MKDLKPIDVVKRVTGKGEPGAKQILAGLSNETIDSLVELYNEGCDCRAIITQDYNMPKPRKEKAPTIKAVVSDPQLDTTKDDAGFYTNS